MNVWFWKSKGQKEETLKEKMKSVMKGVKFEKLPQNVHQLDESYRSLIRELAKR